MITEYVIIRIKVKLEITAQSLGTHTKRSEQLFSSMNKHMGTVE